MGDLDKELVEQQIQIVGTDFNTVAEVTAARRLKVDAAITAASEYDYTANDQYFQVQYDTTPGDLLEHDTLLITNPPGSGKTFLLSKFITTGYGKAVGAIWRLYDNPIITTNGTALTILNRKLGSTVASDLNAYREPTISARGTYYQSLLANDNETTIVNANFSLHLPENRSMLMTLQVSSKDYPIQFNASWAEV
jgi:hypothetical protein